MLTFGTCFTSLGDRIYWRRKATPPIEKTPIHTIYEFSQECNWVLDMFGVRIPWLLKLGCNFGLNKNQCR